MRVLGVDPGSLACGWGIVDRQGSKLTGVAAGTLMLKKSLPLSERLLALHTGLQAVIAEHGPQVMAVEDIFFAKFAQSALKLGHARGVVLLVAAQAGLEVSAYPPALVKRSIAGGGRAEKAQVARIVGAILGWPELPSVDATDALAVAITHANAAPAVTRGRLRG